LKSTLLKTTK